jgi:hypothetical protein
MLKHRLFKPGGRLTRKKIKAKRKFLYFFPGGFQSEKYLSGKRAFMWNAHEEWKRKLNRTMFKQLLSKEKFGVINERALNLESGTKLLFPLEKIALRDALKTPEAARIFAEGLYEYTYGDGTKRENFENFRHALSKLPSLKTRVHTWPVQTLFGFIAHPTRHILLKPMITKAAAKKYDYDLLYKPVPNWETYESMLDFAATIRKDIPGLHPRDFIDLQVFITVLGSDEYPD